MVQGHPTLVHVVYLTGGVQNTVFFQSCFQQGVILSHAMAIAAALERARASLLRKESSGCLSRNHCHQPSPLNPLSVPQS